MKTLVNAIIYLSLLLQAGTAAEKQNIVFIAIDDLNTSIGANRDLDNNFLKTIYPDKELRDQVAKRLTPNLDKFASESRQFINAMCQSPLCGPSRTALMTGVPTHASGYYGHTRNFRSYETLSDVVTLPQYLKANGFFTAGFGKIFHRPTVENLTPKGDWPDTKNSWNKWISSSHGTDVPASGLHEYSPREKDGGNMIWGYSGPRNGTKDWLHARAASELLETDTVTLYDGFTKKDETIRLPKQKPFFLAFGTFRPHLPFYAPKEYFDLFPISEMTIDQKLYDKVVKDIEDLPPAGRSWTQLTKGKFYEVMKRGDHLGGEEGKILAWKYCVQSYLACVAYADDCVGQVLSGLENSKYRDNTTVFLWSDHGYFLGNKARIAKQCLWRESLNCNLIVRQPNMMKPGQPSDEVVQLTDLYATVVEMVGLKRPDHIMGTNLAPAINDPQAALGREYVYSTYGEGNHAVYNKDYKFIRYQNGDKEFYDLKKDPSEYHNLANVEQMRSLVVKWEKKLDACLAE